MERAVFAVGGIAAEALHGKNTVADDKAHACNAEKQRADAEIKDRSTHGGNAHEADECAVAGKREVQLTKLEVMLF